MTHLIEDIEILGKGIAAGGDSAIVGNEGGVVELTQVDRRGVAWVRHPDGRRASTEAFRSGAMGQIVTLGFGVAVSR